jgi:RHS repeat-associated protein
MRFPGQRADSATGLYQNGYREYDAVGRYIQSDPIGLAAGVNTFAYVSSKPLTHIDPLGLSGFGGWTAAPGLSSPEIRQVVSSTYRDYRAWRAWGHQQFPGEKNSVERHCTVSCILSKKHGIVLTRITGIINEYQGFYIHDFWDLSRRFRGQRPWAFQVDDLSSNEKGFACANKQKCISPASDEASDANECKKCCTLGVMYGY